jgi:hypothetical protein
LGVVVLFHRLWPSHKACQSLYTFLWFAARSASASNSSPHPFPLHLTYASVHRVDSTHVYLAIEHQNRPNHSYRLSCQRPPPTGPIRRHRASTHSRHVPTLRRSSSLCNSPPRVVRLLQTRNHRRAGVPVPPLRIRPTTRRARIQPQAVTRGRLRCRRARSPTAIAVTLIWVTRQKGRPLREIAQQKRGRNQLMWMKICALRPTSFHMGAPSVGVAM